MDGKKTESRNNAVNGLKKGETNASAKAPEQPDDMSTVANSEEEASGYYTGSGREGEQKAKGKGFFKRKGPVALILSLILGIGGVSFFSISTELVAWKENISSMFGQNSAVLGRRSNYVVRRLLSDNHPTTKETIFGDTKFKIRSGSKLQKKLSNEGIEYTETEVDGKKLKLLVYEDTDGRRIPIVASDNDVPRANKLVGTEIEIDGVKVKITDQSMSLTQARKVNKNFDTSYDTATLTITGKIAGWFDNVVEAMYERILPGARKQMNIDDPDEEKVKNKLLKNASDELGDTDAEFEVNGKKYKAGDFTQELDDNNKPTGYYVHKNQSGDVDARISSDEFETWSSSDRIRISDTDQPPEGVESALTAKAKKVAMASATIGCAVLKGIGAIGTAIGAIQTLNAISYASKYLEMADQVKSGEANDTVNISLNSINESVTTTLYDKNGKPVEVTGAVTEGAGWNAAFSSTNIIDQDDPGALYVNRENSTKNALMEVMSGNVKDDNGKSVLNSIYAAAPGLANFVAGTTRIGASIAVFRACNAIQGAAGAVSFVADVIALFTFGISKVIKDAIMGGIKGAVLAGSMIAISSIVAALTPKIASWFAGKLSKAFLGIPGSFTMHSGVFNVTSSNMQMSTGLFADTQNAIEVKVATNEAEREWAAYDRATMSPFDVTSKYTFFGSLYSSILPIVNTSRSGIISTVSSVANLVKTSTIALISPTAKAASDTEDYALSLAREGTCPYLESVGVIGDFACNKYVGAYVDELDNDTMRPEDVYGFLDEDGSFKGLDSEGNPIVDEKSDYAKFLVACVSSDTQPGTVSGIVQGLITGAEKAILGDNLLANGLVNFGRNFMAFEGGLDFIEAAEEEKNIKWNSGLACTGRTDDANLNKKIEYFSMYNLDQRVLTNMGITENNSSLTFLENYYKENPIDYSLEGQIARYTGMSKEEAEDALALIEYYNFIANYDSSNRFAFGAPVVEEKHNLQFDNDNQIASMPLSVLLNEISFADLRTRSFAV